MNNNCLICMKKIKRSGLYSLLFSPSICEECFSKMNRRIYKRKIKDITVISFYPYEEFISSLIYSFKGCFDVALANSFLAYDLHYLRIKYKNYYIVPIPSFIDHDLERGFNHVEEMFKCLNLPYLKILKKEKDFKQSSLSKKERETMSKNIVRTSDKLLSDKSILLVDDIITTGSTISRAIDLIKELKPKRLRVLTIAYKVNEMRRNNMNDISKIKLSNIL